MPRSRNVFARRELTVTSPADITQSVKLAAEQVRGRVRLGTEGLAAKLLFGGSSGAEKITTQSDEDGAFAVVLPREGKWLVEVTSEKENVAATVMAEVDGEDAIEIVVPDTTIAGRVVTSDGDSVPAASVQIHTANGSTRRQAAGDGTFRIRGVAEGAARLRGTDRETGAYSRIVEVQSAGGTIVEHIELVIESRQRVAGAVASAGQPLAGVRIHGYGMLGGAAVQERAVTDLEGKFELELPSNATETIFVVGAPGRVLQAFHVVVKRKPLLLDLATAGGSLKLTYPVERKRLLLQYNGGILPMPDLWEWARAHGVPAASGTADVPNVAPGVYRLCADDRCAEGTLVPGGTLLLDTAD